ncbi:amidase [Clohesyomyces aquaticus]|uniref:amidase n=1 Tax=Clohesyomyces aquaticus TaxID=1231657 RepID=A0A1Y1YXT7_9PLEO|nr:amidase [Clohesyomyces aquaticus]
MGSVSWESRAASKQKSSLEKIPKEWLLPTSITNVLQTPLAERPNRVLELDIPRKSGLFSERELDITERYTVEELLERLRAGDLSALEVTVAFSKRAAVAQQLLSCLTEMYFPEAQERARFLDNEKSQGRIVGPLHGLPISLKDSFQIRGLEASLGFVSLLDSISKSSSPLVQILLELGAVVYVKTNIPQTLMTADSHNNIFGRTLNPHNTHLTAGGSSGGEGALVAFRGAPLGVGTDIAGSIRIPSLCCGTYGFKATAARIPDGGQMSPGSEGMSFFLPTAGPLTNNVEALATFSRAVLSTRPALYDSTALDIPWREIADPKTEPKLRVGLLGEDPMFPLHPPVKRAVADAAKTLQAHGHKVIPIPASRAQVADATTLAFAYFFLDGAAMSHITASGEPIVPSVVQVQDTFAAFASNSTFCDDIEGLEAIARLAALNVKRHAIAESWRKMWKDERLDVVIGPPAQSTAVRHDTFGLPPYTLLLNVLDYPACVIPVGLSSSTLDSEPFVMTPGQIGPNYEPEIVAGAPTAIQVFTNRMRDEECLWAAGIIDRCLRDV